MLRSLGFTEGENVWSLEEKNYRMEVLITPEADEAGVFRRQEVRVISDREQIYSLPCSRWEVRP